MFERTITSEDLLRLKREREDADRLYNKTLTALDAAIGQLRELPLPPLPYDELQIAPLSERWELLPLKPAEGGGWLRKLRAQIWSMVAPLFERQQDFNAALVDHINRNVRTHRDAVSVMARVLDLLRQEQENLINFQSALIVFAQQITPYVDTKDREVTGLMRRVNEDVWEVADRLHRNILGLSGAFSGVVDESQKRWESAIARERRLDAEVADIRAALSVVQRASQTLKRELERRTGTDDAAVDASAPPLGPSAHPAARRLDSYNYVAFEDRFRGSQQDIRERLTAYVACFEGAGDVLDLGCGRGEFLDLLREHGITARGIDLNDEMTAVCRARGLEATAGDALTYLLGQPDASLGGLFSAQVVEHLEPDYLMRLLEAAYHKLRPGAKIVLETINAACWYAYFSSYIRDITHVRALHPDTLSYLLVASGFQRVEVRYSAPFPDELKLQTVPSPEETTVAGSPPDLVVVVNENVGKLNSLLFTHLDYAAIGERL